jgi:hypothetical protein
VLKRRERGFERESEVKLEKEGGRKLVFLSTAAFCL